MFDVAIVESLPAAIAVIDDPSDAIVLVLDGLVPSAWITCRRLHERASDIPIVVVASSCDDAIAVEAIANGAQDCVVQDRLLGVSLPRDSLGNRTESPPPGTSARAGDHVSRSAGGLPLGEIDKPAARNLRAADPRPLDQTNRCTTRHRHPGRDKAPGHCSAQMRSGQRRALGPPDAGRRSADRMIGSQLRGTRHRIFVGGSSPGSKGRVGPNQAPSAISPGNHLRIPITFLYNGRRTWILDRGDSCRT